MLNCGLAAGGRTEWSVAATRQPHSASVTTEEPAGAAGVGNLDEPTWQRIKAYQIRSRKDPIVLGFYSSLS